MAKIENIQNDPAWLRCYLVIKMRFQESHVCDKEEGTNREIAFAIKC